MVPRILVLMRSQQVYERITTQSLATVEPYLEDVAAVQHWLSQHSSSVIALLDVRWPAHDEVLMLFERLRIPVQFFEGDFERAVDWLRQYEPTNDSDNTEETPSEELPSPTASETGVSSVTPITERIVEVPVTVEKPVYIQERIVQALPPRLVVVVGLWTRTGVSFVTDNLSYILAQTLPPGNVSMIEHPRVAARLWNYFQCDRFERVDRPYRHWSQHPIAEPLLIGNVAVSPLPPDFSESDYGDEQLVHYLYRQLRRPFIIIDAGTRTTDTMLLEMADDIVLVLDCDPTYLSRDTTADHYRTFLEAYPGAHVVLNKWNKYASQAVKEGFPTALYIPYCNPDVIQKAAWDSAFPAAFPEIREELSTLESRLVHRWVPRELRTSNDETKNRNLFRWRKKK